MEYDIDTDSDIEYEIEATATRNADENAFPINQAEALKILNAPVTRPPLNAARWHPVVEIRRKMVQDGKIAEDDAIDFSDLEYAQRRLAIVRNPYSLATDAAQYSKLCPFESASTSTSAYTPPKDVDAFRLFHSDIQDIQDQVQCHRLIAGHDRVKQTGWLIVNEPLSSDPDALIRFDAAGYLDQLADMDEGDAVLIAVNNRAAPLKAKVAEKRAGSHMFLQHGKTRYRYELKHVERNKFMVWLASTPTSNIITKDAFFRRNVLLTGSDTRPAHVTGDDVLALLKPVAYEAVQKAYPMIDDAVFFKSSWQKNLETQVAAPAAARQNNKKHPKTSSTWRKMLDLNRRQLDDVALVKSILSHDAAPKRVIGTSASARKGATLPPNELVFHSVRESLAAPCGNKKVAYLVLAINEFRYEIKKKPTPDAPNVPDKYTCIFPLEYQIFRLEPTKIPDGKTVWLKTANVTDQFIRPLPLAPEPFDTIPNPARYAELRTPVALEPPLPALTLNGTRSYAHFKGGYDTRRLETVVEFDDLVAMQEADETKGAGQEEENAPPPSTFIERLAHAGSVTLHPGQIAFIDKCLTNERQLTAKNFKGAMENMLRCFSIFVILAQISLPRLIIADVGVQTVKTSFPMGPLGNFGLVEHMVAVMNKLVKAEFGADANPRTQEWMLGSIKALLKSKPILQMQLEKQMRGLGQGQDQDQVPPPVFVPAWKPLVMRRVYIDHLVKLERETAPLQAAQRFQGMANKAARTVTTGLYIARRLPVAAGPLAPAPTIRQFNMRLAPLDAPPPSPPDLATWIAGLVKKNGALQPALAPLATATKNQDLWNELSAQIVHMPGPEFVKKLIMTKTQKNKNKNIINILIKFIAFDLKDLLARFAFNYTGPEGFRHLEQIKKMHAVGSGLQQQQVMSVLNDCIAGFDVFTIAPPDDDLIYVLVYVLLRALERLDPSTVAYLAAGLEAKIALNTTTVATAREGYEIVRERRKTRIMAAYGDMDRDLRRAIKKAVTGGLTSNDAVVAKSERDREHMAAVSDSAHDNYDANATEE